MSLEAWGDTDEDRLIDAMAHPVAAALADVRDTIAGRIRNLTLLTKGAQGGSIPFELWQAQIRELRSLEAYVEEQIKADLGPRQ